MSTGHYAEVVVNIEMAISDAYHYHIPADMRPTLRVGHLVEVEFGRQLAQGIVMSHLLKEDIEPVVSIAKCEKIE